MGVLKFLVHLLANIIWQRIGGKDGIPPVRLPKGKGPVVIPVMSPWQTVVAMWTMRKLWAAFGGQFKDILSSSPNGTAQQVGSWLPNAPAKPKKPAASKAAAVAPSVPAPNLRAPQTWTATAQPAATPAPPSPPAAQAAAPGTPPAATSPAPRRAPNYATRPFNADDQDAAAGVAPVAPAPTAAVPPAPVAAPAAPPVAAPPTPVDSPAAPGSKLRPGSLLSSLRRRS